MIEKVNMIAKNPLASKDIKLIKQDKDDDQLETVKIQNTIVKIGMLLILGFGEAGSQIIAKNLAQSNPFLNFLILS